MKTQRARDTTFAFIAAETTRLDSCRDREGRRRFVDPLGQIKARPLFVAEAVRTALRDVVAWRIGGGAAPRADALVAAAVASARLALDVIESESTERSQTLALVQSTAKRFAASALCRRLMTVPASQFLRLAHVAHGPDAVIRDRRRRLHAVALTFRGDAFEAGQLATSIAAQISLPVRDRLAPLTVHVFSLVTENRHSFERDTIDRPGGRVGARVA